MEYLNVIRVKMEHFRDLSASTGGHILPYPTNRWRTYKVQNYLPAIFAIGIYSRLKCFLVDQLFNLLMNTNPFRVSNMADPVFSVSGSSGEPLSRLRSNPDQLPLLRQTLISSYNGFSSLACIRLGSFYFQLSQRTIRFKLGSESLFLLTVYVQH